MFFGWIRRFLFPILPGLIAAAASYALARHGGDVPLSPHSWLGLLPLILLGATFLLGALFRQFRISLIAIPCAAVAWCCLPVHELTHRTGTVAALLLPIWFTVSTLQQERRPLSVLGLVTLSFSLFVTALLLLVAHGRAAGAIESLRILQPLPSSGTWWNLPPAALGLAAAAAVALLVPRGQRRINVLILQALLLQLLALNAQAEVLRLLPPQRLFVCASAGTAALLLWAVLDGAWQHAFVDELTGLPGRCPLTQHLASLGRHYSVAVVDVDHFKRVNDRHGHAVGDQVLRYIAARLKRCRPGTAYRYGGEEFVIVFSGRRFTRHVGTLEGLRESIAEKPFVIRGKARPEKKPKKTRKDLMGTRKKINITVSIGIAKRDTSRRKSHEVLKAADKALYKAKRGGRNRVCKA